MPTSTFYNLSSEKRNNILEAAKKEFITNSFYDASINKIIKDANISRGSFYLYFKNKEDLFVYLMQGYRNEVLEKITSDVDKKDCDILELALLIFNFITNENNDSEFKKILCSTISKIDINLINRCIMFQDESFEIEIIKKYTNIEKLNINTEKDIIYISEMVFSATLTEIIYMFSGKYNAQEARKNIERKFEFIKYGILNKY